MCLTWYGLWKNRGGVRARMRLSMPLCVTRLVWGASSLRLNDNRAWSLGTCVLQIDAEDLAVLVRLVPIGTNAAAVSAAIAPCL